MAREVIQAERFLAANRLPLCRKSSQRFDFLAFFFFLAVFLTAFLADFFADFFADDFLPAFLAS